MGRVDDLIAFLKARLDEAESTAKETLRSLAWMIDNGMQPAGRVAAMAEETVPRMGRVLRDVAADRKLIAEWQKAEADPAVDDQWNAGLAAGLRLAVQIRTARYSDHPDYRPEWER
jgi:hypothetical protein